MTTETVDFGAARKAAEAAGLLGSGDYFKLKEGSNRIRLMSMCLPHPGEYQGKKNFKWLCYVLDRRDGKPKPYFMQHTVYKQIEALQTNEDYCFASVPMPYDITINAKAAGTIDAEYTVIPSPKLIPITATEAAEYAALKPLGELQTMLNKAKEESKPTDKKHEPQWQNLADPAPELTDEDIPFMR